MQWQSSLCRSRGLEGKRFFLEICKLVRQTRKWFRTNSRVCRAIRRGREQAPGFIPPLNQSQSGPMTQARAQSLFVHESYHGNGLINPCEICLPRKPANQGIPDTGPRCERQFFTLFCGSACQSDWPWCGDEWREIELKSRRLAGVWFPNKTIRKYSVHICMINHQNPAWPLRNSKKKNAEATAMEPLVTVGRSKNWHKDDN